MKEESSKRGPMRHLDKRQKFDRRSFLRGGGLTAIGVAVVPAGTLTLAPVTAHAEQFSTLGAETGRTLVRMARDIFPHDQLPERFYARAVAPHDAAAAKDAGALKLMRDGVASLDAKARQRHGKPYVDVPTEAERVELLKQIEASAFFQKVKGDLVTGLYDDKELWPLLGYEGSSWEKGGYLHRGFDDIDWIS